ncbi:uroporphyrinogen-III C-methyltransferase, partial [Paenibacillus sp. TAF58]
MTLVGGGPGDADLMTVAGRDALANADVVLHDRLGPRDDLHLLAPAARLIDVGKTPGHHAVPQREIERLLLDNALDGHHVVRLKGGDPFVFGRGGEEVIACRSAGIPVTVIPGVTSAIAVPGAAGIPVTHREI